MQVYKYAMSGGPGSTLLMSIPGPAKALSCGVQADTLQTTGVEVGTPVFWFSVNPGNAVPQDWLLCAVFTGQDVPGEYTADDFVGTAVDPLTGLVYHFFAKKHRHLKAVSV